MNIFIFGDSIPYGQFVSPHKNWVVRISHKLSVDYPSSNIVVMNSSISGNTTRMALERMQFDVQSHGIEMLLIQFGMNDCNYWETDRYLPRVNKEAFKHNLIEIILRGRVFGAKKIFISTNHPTLKTQPFSHFPKITYQQSNESYNKVIRHVARQTKCILIDHERKWKNELKKGVQLKNLLLKDGIHLSNEGHDLYFSYVMPLIDSEISSMLRSNK